MTTRLRLRRAILATASSIFAVATATPAQAQAVQAPPEQAALERAIAAEQRATEALQAAQQALDEARALRQQLVGTRAIVPAAEQTAAVADANPLPGLGNNPSTFCQDPARIVASPPTFEGRCLVMRGWRDYSSTNLNTTITGSSDAGQIAVSLPYTRRFRGGDGSTSYARFEPGVRAKVGEGTSTATFGDLSDFAISSGVAATFNAEFGWNSPAANEEATVRTALFEARRQCMDHYTSSLAAGAPTTEARKDPNHPACEGDNFREWLRDKGRRNGYYRAITRPLWGYDAVPRFLVGAEGSYGRADYTYLPLTDPAMTGVPLLTELPDASKGELTVRENPFSFGVYVGTGVRLGEWRGLGRVSLTYRRDFAYPKDSEDQQICGVTGTTQVPGGYIQCYERDIAPPYEMEGLVAGLRLRAQSPRWGFLPRAALGVDLTFALEEERFGIRAPLYFITDNEGAPNGGVVFACESDGRTRTGYKLEGNCTAALFVSTSFSLGNR